MSTSKRRFREENIRRGYDETFVYTFDLSPLPAGTYSEPACRIEDSAGEDVTAELLDGAASIDDGWFVTPTFVAGAVSTVSRYTLFWSVKIDGETWSGFGAIRFEE
jgi:hypothetical protein